MSTTDLTASRPARFVAPCLALLAGLFGASCSSTSSTGGDAAPSTTAPEVNSVGAMKAGPADSAPVAGGKITYGIDAEPEGLDPTRYAFSQAGHAVASAVFDPLATLDENGNAIPYLATGFEPNADYTEWTIKLPAGVSFHDGTPLDADAVISVFEAYRNGAITGPSVRATVQTVSKKDPTSISLKLTQAVKAFPLLFTTQMGYIPAPAMLTNTDLVKKPIGTGPFVFESHLDGESWSFRKNDTYRQKGLPHLDALEFVPVVDNAERNNKLRAGDLDVIQTYSGPQILELRNEPGLKRVENRHGDKAIFMLNTTTPPFDNLNARKAIAYATDAAKWRKEIHADVALPANSPYGPGQPGYLKDNGFPTYDLEAAKKAVAQYKADTGNDLEFTFLAVNDPNSAKLAQTFATQFEKAGIKVTVQQLAQINLLAQAATGKYQMTQFRLFGAPNPDADVQFYRSTSIVPEGISVNFPRYASPVVDEGIAAAIATDDPAKRTAAYESVSRNLGEQVPYVWLGETTWVVASNARVNGIYGAMNGSISTVGPKTWIQSLSVKA